MEIEQKTEGIKLNRNEVLQKRKSYWAARRVQDILLSAAALVILGPLMLVIAGIILLESPGASPIFVQDRVGRDGQVFRFYKFRSMVPDAESKLNDLLDQNEMDGPAFKIQNDPRVTKVGRFLRRTCLDELPQLVNVLKGDMTLVGPRPPLPREVAQYDAYQRQRLYVTPGLTCYWQVQPNRIDLSFDEWMALDMQYIGASSIRTDWRIILKTLGVMLSMRGM